MARITIPYAVADFVDLRERGYIMWIRPISSRAWKIITLLFSSVPGVRQEFAYLYLGCYYDRTKADRFEELFGRTWIGEHPTEEHNRYMVVRYDFSKMVMADDMEGLERNFNDLIVLRWRSW